MKQELDFIVIGAQKAGTTSLFEYLRRHAEISMPAAKEVPYFSHNAHYGRDWGEYLRKAFPSADPRTRWGTVTPHYMVGGIYDATSRTPPITSDERTVPLRIHERLPAARLIAIIRDPVERARSHHAMAVMNGWDSRSFSTAIDELLEAAALAQSRRFPAENTGYITWGEYGRILAGYLDVFPREQLLVLYTSALKNDPAGVMRTVFEFLDVDSEYVPDNLGTAYRPSGSRRRFRWLNLSAAQKAAASSSAARRLWHALPERTRRRVDKQFDRLNYLTDLWNRRPGDTTPEAGDPRTIRALREHFEEDAHHLAEMFGDRPPWSQVALSQSGHA